MLFRFFLVFGFFDVLFYFELVLDQILLHLLHGFALFLVFCVDFFKQRSWYSDFLKVCELGLDELVNCVIENGSVVFSLVHHRCIRRNIRKFGLLVWHIHQVYLSDAVSTLPIFLRLETFELILRIVGGLSLLGFLKCCVESLVIGKACVGCYTVNIWLSR